MRSPVSSWVRAKALMASASWRKAPCVAQAAAACRMASGMHWVWSLVGESRKRPWKVVLRVLTPVCQMRLRSSSEHSKRPGVLGSICETWAETWWTVMTVRAVRATSMR